LWLLLKRTKFFFFKLELIFCTDKNHLDVEIVLQDVVKQKGVAEYQLLLPKI
jgi:hypothetical protein